MLTKETLSLCISQSCSVCWTTYEEIFRINVLVSLAFTMHGTLKLLQQQTISVSTFTWLDVNSIFSSLLFVLYVTAREFNIRIPFSLSIPGFAGCIVWISQLVQLYFLCFQGVVDRIYLGSFLRYFPPCTLLQYCWWLGLFFFDVFRKIIDCQNSYGKSI